MKRIGFGMLAFAMGTFMIASTATSQPPGKDGGKGGPGGGMKGGYGKIIPGFMIVQLKLTEEQKTAIAAIENEVKAKLDKILTAEQKKTLENPRGPGGDKGKGPGGDKGKGPGGDRGKGPGGEKKGEKPPVE